MASKAALVDAVSTLLSSEYSVFAMFALVSYDWLINLDKEIQYFWDYRKGRKLTAAALLYGLSRYPAIIGEIFQLPTAFPLSDTAYVLASPAVVAACYRMFTGMCSSCRIVVYFQTAVNIPYAISPAMFSAIRVYALLPNNKTIAVSTFLLLFVPTFLDTIINIMDKAASQPSPFNCSIVKTPVTPEVASRSRGISAIIGDFLVLFVTWYSTYTSYRAQRGVLKGPSLVQIMLYNGSFYFIALTAMNVLNMLFIPISSPLGVTLGSIANTTNNPVTAVLTCHFLFDLREAHRSAAPPSSPSAMPSLYFAEGSPEEGSRGALPAFIASMGSQLQSPGLRLMDSDAEGLDVDGRENAREQEDLDVQGDENATGMSIAVSVERKETQEV